MRITLAFLALFLGFYSFGQREYKWGHLPEKIELENEYEEDVVILNYFMDYHFGLGTYNKYAEYYYCLVNERPDKNQIYFQVNLHEINRLETLSIRIIKQNGEVNILNNKEIDIVRKVDLDYNRVLAAIKVENLEKEDRFELAFEVQENRILYGRDFWAHHYFPAIQNNFKITNHSALPLSILSNMDHSVLKTDNKGNMASISWQVFETPGGISNPHVDPELTIPFVSYMIYSFESVDPTINYSDEMKTKQVWTEWYVYYKEKFATGLPTNFKYGKLKNQTELQSRNNDYDDPDMKLLQSLVNYFSQSYDIKRFEHDRDKYAKNDFERKEHLTYFEMISIYFHFLRKSRLKFDIGMASKIMDGKLNENGFNAFRISSFFFRIHTTNGSHYLFPNDPFGSYNIDEIPLWVQGTKAAIYDASISLKRFNIPEFVMLPQEKSSDNKITVKSVITIDEDFESNIDRKISISGGINQLNSNFIKKKLAKVFGEKSELANIQGREGVYEYQMEDVSLAEKLKNDTIHIDLLSLYPEPLYTIQKQSLDAMLPFKYQFKQNEFFSFPGEVRMIKPEFWSYKETLQYYSISYRIHQVNPKTIMFQFEEKFTRKYLSSEELKNVIRLREEVKEYLENGVNYIR